MTHHHERPPSYTSSPHLMLSSALSLTHRGCLTDTTHCITAPLPHANHVHLRLHPMRRLHVHVHWPPHCVGISAPHLLTSHFSSPHHPTLSTTLGLQPHPHASSHAVGLRSMLGPDCWSVRQVNDRTALVLELGLVVGLGCYGCWLLVLVAGLDGCWSWLLWLLVLVVAALCPAPSGQVKDRTALVMVVGLHGYGCWS
ncbi:hypothetical protein CC80DRAFT_250093 [Byssothecium circinans]|uniref:Uncharacterized protein n=1 Tax=Byssothecium circinans TaxID=147558 RepID=A0A6A5TBC2_9PLEO|nr:hypothetical protein CC80DRAFT_250093 [Byssothecium circinans]